MSEENYMELLFEEDGMKRRVVLAEDFLRPLYQYTSLEIRNTQRENRMNGKENS